ncbi:MAG TPA: COX15/CtaA family protein, partial [Azospirillaceae bacterium]|nr:COX15/CtaA family protein [Azospirillaceae bacterium]
MTSLAFDLDRPAPPSARAVAGWLLLCAALVFAMAVIGAITRLTESGLSMVEWKPLIGVLPPLSEAEWNRVFDLYRRTPEYRLHNAGMSLAAFKGIFWWEWFHRLWGHLIGAAFAGGLAWFWAQGRIARGLRRPLLGLLALGGLQGVIGWFMVMSGLVDRPWVSPYRLALHLGMAVLIYALLLRLALGVLEPVAASPPRPGLRKHAGAALAL